MTKENWTPYVINFKYTVEMEASTTVVATSDEAAKSGAQSILALTPGYENAEITSVSEYKQEQPAHQTVQ